MLRVPAPSTAGRLHRRLCRAPGDPYIIDTIFGRPAGKGAALSERRYELDWLRVLAVLLLIFFHSARVFDFGDFYVKNDTLSFGMEVFVVFIDLWFMPLFFSIAGAAAFFALARRSGGKFLSERTKRLLVPFVFGMLVIVPPQIFCVYLQKPGNPASYISFWKYQFSVPPFTQIIAGKVDDALITAYTWETGHLWFIQYLFVFCVVALPLLAVDEKGKARAARVKDSPRSARSAAGAYTSLPYRSCSALWPCLRSGRTSGGSSW